MTSLLALAACHRDGPVDPLDAPDVQAGVPLPPVAVNHGSSGAVEVFVDTYDGSGQVVEPDIAYVPGGWHGFEYWMAVNPYPGSNDLHENASIYAGADGLSWAAPVGIHNPVVPFPAGETRHNSDPDLVFNPDPGRLILFDRAVTNAGDELREQVSDDGVLWSAQQTVVTSPEHNLISPAVTLVKNRRARLWYVETGTAGCQATSSTVAMSRWMGAQAGPEALIGKNWSAPVATNLRGPGDYVAWHLDVIYISELRSYWAVFPAYHAKETCALNDLFVARSRDGVHWTTLEQPLIARGSADFVGRSLYRSSIVYDPASASLKVWFSGQDGLSQWHMGYQAFKITSLEGAIDAQRHRNGG